MALYVTAVDENSPAERFGLTVGCALLAIDGHPLNDALDYQFYTTPTSFSLEVCENEQHRTVQITKAEYEPLGCNFKTYLGDEKHSCANHCMFCFIDQLPPGMREPLYFKDDDERLSFLFGNYITLTNLTDHEIDRIIQMHISPIFVSVHTTNPALRVRMLANKRGGEVLKYLPRLVEGGIAVNCQLVLCRGINDGDELRRTLSDLLELTPMVQSIAAVPCGVTDYREKLFKQTPYDAKTSAEVIDIMEEQKRENKEELQQETAEEKNSGQGNSSTRSSLLWIFAGGYLVYTGYRLCASVISGAEDSGMVFLAAGGIFVVIGAVLLIMAIRNLAKAGAQKHELEEAAAKKAAEEASQNPETVAKKKMSIAERAHLAENLDDAPEEKDEK